MSDPTTPATQDRAPAPTGPLMRVARLHGVRDVRLHDAPVPEPAPG
jgi:hypothetical protein